MEIDDDFELGKASVDAIKSIILNVGEMLPSKGYTLGFASSGKYSE